MWPLHSISSRTWERGQGEHWRDEAAGHFDRHTLPSGEDQAVIILIPLPRKLRPKDMGFQP